LEEALSRTISVAGGSLILEFARDRLQQLTSPLARRVAVRYKGH
jgi:hypothetical protein|tara:strand:+ start:12512 stop:12643 length:132 start_codon:yes stop_codon:yes gene_type:complete